MRAMLVLDVILRYATVGLLLGFAGLALRDGRGARPARYAALLALSVAALMLSTPPPGFELPLPLHAVARFADAPNIALAWWFGRSLFEDDFTLGPIEWAGFGTLTALMLELRLDGLGVTGPAPAGVSMAVDALAFAMMGHLAYVTLRGRRDDLVEARRTFRVAFVLALAAATVVAMLAEMLLSETFDSEVSTLRVAIALPLTLAALFWLARLDPERLAFAPTRTMVAPSPAIDPRDAPLRDRLLALMETENAYAEPGLTITRLAERLGAPEHRLRALINKGLGHRNFSAFVNERRIAAAKAALADADQARTPVLTIAMDVGFNSLAPFNRAFKAAEGVTPTEYRRAALSEPRDPEKD